jgi:hypothetical protein
MRPNPIRRAAAETPQRILEHLRQAREACQSANLARLVETLDMLQSAATEFSAWTAQVRSEPRVVTVSQRSELTRVKREAASLLRLVDACAAVQRGLAARSGAMAVAYSPSGSAPIAASGSSAYDMQG